MSLEEESVSFRYLLGDMTQTWVKFEVFPHIHVHATRKKDSNKIGIAYSQPGCKGESVKINKWPIGPDTPHDFVCWDVDVGFWNKSDFTQIRSNMMD